MTHLNRRSFIAAAAVAPLAGVAHASATNKDENLELLVAIRSRTGLSLDELADWFEDIPTPMLEKIKHNILAAPVLKWSYRQTFASVMAIKAGEIHNFDIDPNQAFCIQQVRLKGDTEAIRKVISCFNRSKSIAPALMDFA